MPSIVINCQICRQVVREFPRCHARAPHSILQNEGGGVAHPEAGYDLFLTAASGDGLKLWDLRAPGGGAVQRFDTVAPSSRHASRPALSPCMRHVAAGAEDGHVYVWDTRQLRGHLRRLDTRAQVVTAVSFGPARGHLVAASLEGLVTSFTSEA